MKKIITILLSVFSCSLLANTSHQETKIFSELGVSEIFVNSPSDDPRSYQVDDVEYEVSASPFMWVIPGPGSKSKEVVPQDANNNLAIEFFENRLFLAFRTAPTYYPSKKSKIYVVSTADGSNWDLEWVSKSGREKMAPQLLSYQGQLHLYYSEGGKNTLKFNPLKVLKLTRSDLKNWSAPEEILAKGEVPWEMKVRNGVIWMTSYQGPHLRLGGGSAEIYLQLKKSSDAKNFSPENEARENITLSGVSEAGFEFDPQGNLWGVTKNEDGDESGFGAHMVYAQSNLLSYWTMASTSKSYHSPRMFRHGKDIYLIARRHRGARPYDWARKGGYSWRRFWNWTRYALTPKTTALYKMNQEKLVLEHVMDLPGAGDTGYASIRRVDAHTYLIGNYSSGLKRKNKKWITGKFGDTKIYLMALKFKPVSP